MDEIKCIACHKLNSAGDRFCAACGSSLDLKLCTSCEAINNPVADHCHSCGKPLAAQAAPTAAVEVSERVSETPFYAPRRWEVYDARPSLGSRIARAAKGTVLVALPLAAIGVWAYQFHGERLLRLVLPAAMPAAEIQTKITPVPLVVLSPVAEPVAAPAAVAAKPPVVEAKRPPKPSPASVARVEAARGVTHTLTGAAAVVQEAAAAQKEAAAAQKAPQPVADVVPVPAAGRGRVTHTRATITQEVKPAVPEGTPARPRPGAVACPQTQAILGLCTANTKREGS